MKLFIYSMIIDCGVSSMEWLAMKCRRCREAAKLSVKELSEISGISWATIYRIEGNEIGDPHVYTWRMLVKVFKTYGVWDE